ncbi:MAG: hypothetical protein JSS56_24850 [Proteobacteria bacterium]|nr:hypothetical protein [Pseudomonadota bacterium]
MSQQDLPPPPTYSGRCLCGAVRYEVDGDISFASHCHCRPAGMRHIHVASKAPWYEICDSLPRFDGNG